MRTRLLAKIIQTELEKMLNGKPQIISTARLNPTNETILASLSNVTEAEWQLQWRGVSQNPLQ
jgi:hypothetical protein